MVLVNQQIITHKTNGTKMKKLSILLLSLFFLFFIGCSDDDSNPSDPEEELNLNSELFGTWTFVDSNNDVHGWQFNSDGSAVQIQYNQSYDWKWTMEDSQIKLYVTGGTPAYYTYKIEGNYLYLWVDVIGDWGLPYTKQ